MIIPVMASIIRLRRVIPLVDRKPHASHIQTSPNIPMPAILTDFDVFMTDCEVNKFSSNLIINMNQNMPFKCITPP